MIGTKKQMICQSFRNRIVRGELAPGCRLPTRQQIIQSFDTSAVTAQAVFDELSDQRFIVTRGRAGTFVADRPPHLCRYGLVFPFPPTPKNQWSLLYEALLKEAATFGKSRNLEIPLFYDVIGHEDPQGQLAELVNSVENHRVAGLIFAASPHLLAKTPVINAPGISRVAIMDPGEIWTGISIVYVDWNLFIDRSVEYLSQRGCKRLALISHHLESTFVDQFARRCAEAGIATGPWWMHPVHPDQTTALGNLIHLMMRAKPEDRPDGIVVADDNLTANVVQSLQSAGVSIGPGRDVEVLSHCNIPHLPNIPAPITWLGFDVRQMLGACVNAIDQTRAGETPQTVLLPAEFYETNDAGSNGKTFEPRTSLNGYVASPI